MIRNFSPESANPRERRAYAHAMVEGHRNRDIARHAAEKAIESASGTQKGRSSGFEAGLDRAGSYESVRGAGAAYNWSRWPYPPSDSPREHYVFDDLGNERTREPVNFTGDAWPVVRDELAARGYGMHDAGYGPGTNGNGVVAVVLDRELEVGDQIEIFKQYGWIGHDDPVHETSFC